MCTHRLLAYVHRVKTQMVKALQSQAKLIKSTMKIVAI